MSVPSPEELLARYGAHSPAELAAALGFRVERRNTPPVLPGVAVLSEYRPQRTIVLYLPALLEQSARRCLPPARLEGWLIAHELYHALAESAGASSWQVSEQEADRWADELVGRCL